MKIPPLPALAVERISKRVTIVVSDGQIRRALCAEWMDGYRRGLCELSEALGLPQSNLEDE